MGLFDIFKRTNRRDNLTRDYSLTFQDLGSIGERRALGQSAFWSAVNQIIGDLGSLPLNVYDRTKDGGRQRLDVSAKSFLPYLLRLKPNPYQTVPTFMGVVVYDLLLKGGAFIFKGKNVIGEVVELHRMNPDLMEVIWDGWAKWYRYNGVIMSDDEVIHILGLSNDGLRGLSLLEVCNRSLTAVTAIDDYAGVYFKNSSMPAGVMSTEAQISETAKKQAKADWEGLYSGTSNQHKIAVLSGSWKFQPISANALDSQLIEARQFTVLEVARLFRMPPHKLGDMTKVSYSSMEASQLDYWQSCLRPLAVKIESALNVGLIAQSMQSTRFVEFDYTSIVKPDSAGMTSLLDAQVKAGLITINEARAKLNLNRIDGGDFLMIPQNMSKLENGEIQPLNALPEPNQNQITQEPKS